MLSQQFVEVLGEVITVRKLIKRKCHQLRAKGSLISLTASDQERISPYYI